MPKRNLYVKKIGGRLTPTKRGYQRLVRDTTNPKGQVFAFTYQAPPLMVAASMARLSRRSGDLRLTYLEEFAAHKENVAGLIDRVVTGYGDDSVQQLVGLHLVVEGASNILTKMLEYGRIGAAYLEPSTRYIFFDVKDEHGNWPYYRPQLKRQVRTVYTKDLDQIFDNYSRIVRGLTAYLRTKYPEPKEKKERLAWLNSTRATACDSARPLLPVATTSTVGIFANTQAIEHLIMRLLAEDLKEAQIAGQRILREARKVAPSFLRRADLPDRGGATTAYKATTKKAIRQMARENLDFSRPKVPTFDVNLLNHWPKDELDLVPTMLFDQAENLSLTDIQGQVANWPLERRIAAFQTYMGKRLNRRQKPGRALEKAHFEWEMDMADGYDVFRDWQRHRVVDSWQWQRLSPYFGFDVPPLIIEAGFEEDFHACFKISLNLYELMLSEGYEQETQYATLLGHKMRYHYINNLRQLFHMLELRTTPAGHPGYRKTGLRMYDLLESVYPLSARAMIFVNKGESEELYRLAAEMTTQFKLERLSR